MRSNTMKIVYVIVERNGRINVRLYALPVNGEMQIRDYVPRTPEGPYEG